MEELSKDDLINKWKTERNKLLSELSFCSYILLIRRR